MTARDRWLLVEENGDLWLIKREGHELHGRIVSREGFELNFLGFMMHWWASDHRDLFAHRCGAVTDGRTLRKSSWRS